MELDAFDGQFFMPYAHDHAVLGPAGYGEALGHGIRLDDERVVAGRLEALWQAPVHALAVVHYPRGLAVYGLPAHDLSPVGLSYSLVTEADAEHRDPSGAFSITPSEIPASFGVQGPGETTILSGWSAGISSGESSSLRRTTTSALSSPRYWTRLYVKES